MAIALYKGQKIDLTKTNPGFKTVRAGLGWDPDKYDGSEYFDVDVSVFMTAASGKVEKDLNFVCCSNPSDEASSVIHGGGDWTDEGDDEIITIDLDKVPADVEKISFTVTIHKADERGQNFGQVSEAYIRIINDDDSEELVRYDLGGDFSVEDAIVVAELYRYNGEWKFAAVGSGSSGGLAALCKDFGVAGI